MQKRCSEKGYDKAETAITLTPLCDVSMVLLITLMIISPMIMQSLIRVSKSAAVDGVYADGRQEKPLFIHIKEDETLINTQPVKSEIELAESIRNEFQLMADKNVMVTSDSNVLLENVVRVLDIAKQNGAQGLSLLKSKE
ncbi:MAG: ExbD/TolR family protein [Elusimicrobiota bacterium]